MFSKFLYQELEDYRLTNLYKEGSNGAIFQAIHHLNQNRCAIKMLDIEKLSIYHQEKGIDDFLSYLKFLEKIEHPGMVSLLNSGIYQQFIWIAEEWMEAPNLQNFLEKNGKVDIFTALQWMESCVNILEYLYQKELKHNNLKPKNIWILENKTKLSGLGLGTDIINLTKYQKENLEPLNPHYLAPEQILGEKSDIRTDLYVLGAIFYEMITGRTLYEGNYPFLIMQSHINGISPSFMDENPEIPEEIFIWLLKLLSKSPQERFLNPAEFKPFLKKSLSFFLKRSEDLEDLSKEYPIPKMEEWDIPLLEFPKQNSSVEKTQSLKKIKTKRPTRSFNNDFVKENCRDQFLDQEEENTKQEEPIEIVKISKSKKLPFQPAVFDDIPQDKAIDDELNASFSQEMVEEEKEQMPVPLPKDFITEHRHYYYTHEIDTGIRNKTKGTPFPQNFSKTRDSLEHFHDQHNKINRTKRLSIKQSKKDTKSVKRYRQNRINFFFIFCMTVLSLGIFFVWYRIESMPRPNQQPKIVKRPKIIYKITEDLGWFGEKMPKGMIRSEKRGEYIWKKDESIMLYIPVGAFWRGDDQGRKCESPAKKIYLSGFYIDKYELTNAQYLRFTEDTGYNPPSYISQLSFNDLRQPVVGINWYDAQRYAKWAQKRLPTEAEWEKAAKGGLMIPDWQGQDIPIKLIKNPIPKRIYPWGNEKPEKREYRVLNYKAKQDNYKYTAFVTAFSEGISPYGCFNIVGNVWEFCSDRFSNEFYNTLIFTDPTGPFEEDIRQRVCRGGSWGSDEKQTTCFYRFSFDANYKGNSVGVRLAKSSKTE